MFRYGLRHGTGVCKFPNGCFYQGEWKADKPEGGGKFYSPGNEIIDAFFTGGKLRDGKAKVLFTNGDYYEGELKNKCRNDEGTHYYVNGDVYKG
mmetsp:Transcript_7520/g.5420  ORF Transcript_7520/g.5420 Transcript_7520/m.5420 type:complete len:94 (-) Transcript_7520:1163-1444(-)